MALRPLTAELIEQYTARGTWQRETLYDVVDGWAQRSPDTVAVADQHQRLTYAELVRQSKAMANWLVAQDLVPGAAVALQTSNRTAIAVCHLACDRADLVFVPLSSAWRATEMRHLLKVSEATVFIAPPPYKDFDFVEMANSLRPVCPQLRLIGSFDGAGGDFDLDEVCHFRGADVPRERDPNVPRYVMVTSGTTGLPRMSLWTDNNLYYFMQRYISAVQMQAGDIAVGLAPASTGATGYVYPVLAPILSGATSILLEDWSPEAGLDLIEKESATLATAVPTQVVKMLQDDSIGSRDFSALRVFTNAGASMPPDSARQMEEAFGCTDQVCYGSTDGGVPAMTRVVDPPLKRYMTVGKPFEDSDLRLLDLDGNPVAAGEPGELCWRSPTKTFGYFNEPEATAEAFSGDGWYRSGDLGRIDDDGYLEIVGRSKDVIIRGGQNLSPREIEDLISQHPAVSLVSVVGVPDAVYGERACACVATRDGFSLALEDIVDFLKQQQLASFKLPERLELFDDLPRSAGGKISKVELRVQVLSRTEKLADS